MDRTFTHTNKAGADFEARIELHPKSAQGVGDVGWSWQWKYTALEKWVEMSPLRGVAATATADQAEAAARQALDRMWESGASRAKSQPPVDPPPPPIGR